MSDACTSSIVSLIPMVTGSISCIGSVIIIALILRSQSGLSSAYHRIIFGLSVSDIIHSLALGLVSIPMPKGTPNAWKALGNLTTCDLQGFFYMFGAMAAPAYNCSLSFYYMYKIKFKTSEEDMRKYKEPFLHGIPILLALICAIIPLSLGSFNPSVSWCWIQSYPFKCHEDPEVVCERGNKFDPYLLRWLVQGGPYVILFILICAAMSISYVEFRYEERRASAYRAESSVRMEFTAHRKFLRRAFQYVIAVLLTLVFPLISNPLDMYHTNVVPIEFLTYTFYPLQGLFNLLVYVSGCVSTLRERNTNLPLCQAIIDVFTGSKKFRSAQESSSLAVDSHDGSISINDTSSVNNSSGMADPGQRTDLTGISSCPTCTIFENDSQLPSDSTISLFLESAK